MKERVMVLRADDKDALYSVIHIKGVKVAEDSNMLWLRYIQAEDKPVAALLSLPVVYTYYVDAEERLFPLHGITPVDRLKPMQWHNIADWLKVELPVSSLPAQLSDSYTVKLMRTETPAESSALLCDWISWAAYVETAPEIRLKPLRFAVSENGKVLVSGRPLPPVPGTSYWQRGNVLVRDGFDFDPPFIISLMAKKYGLDKDTLMLFDTDASWQCIPLEHLLPVSRSAVRNTQKEMHEHGN